MQDASNADRVKLVLAKSKGERFDDVNLELDKEARWFTLSGEQPASTVPTSYDLVLQLLETASRGELVKWQQQ